MSENVTTCKNPSCKKPFEKNGKARYCSSKCRIAHFRSMARLEEKPEPKPAGKIKKKKEPIEAKVSVGKGPKKMIQEAVSESYEKSSKKVIKNHIEQGDMGLGLPPAFQSKLTIDEGLTNRGIFVPGKNGVVEVEKGSDEAKILEAFLQPKDPGKDLLRETGKKVIEALNRPLPDWVQKVQGFCEKHEITPDDLIKFYVEGGKPGKGKEEKTKAPAQTNLSYMDRRRQLKNGSNEQK